MILKQDQTNEKICFFPLLNTNLQGFEKFPDKNNWEPKM